MMTASRYRCLSGSALKVLAMTSMLCDHLAGLVWRETAWIQAPICGALDGLTPYALMRGFGRLAFPLFAFLLVEGFFHTRDKLRYGIRLAAFAAISEVPWNLCVHGAFTGPTQNVMFTLLLGYMAVCSFEVMHGETFIRALTVLSLVAASFVLNADFGALGVGLIILLYALRSHTLAKTAVGAVMLGGSAFSAPAILSFIPMAMYDGTRGFIKGPVGKYTVYVFYPLHLLIIYLIIR